MPNRQQRRAAARAGAKAAPTVQLGKKSGGVCVAYCHPVGEVGARFHTSLLDLIVRDHATSGHVVAHMPLSSGANIVTARNKIVKTFLESTTCEWLWFLDADMTFQPDTLDRLLASADKKERPIMGGLCFALLKGEAQEIVPTLYGFSQAQQMVRYNGFPENQVVQVVGTGAACLLVHRSVFETILNLRWTQEREDAHVAQFGVVSGRAVGSLVFPPPWPWFQEQITGLNWGDSISEDLTFCLRAAQAGFPVHVDTSIEIGHVKPVVIDKEAFYKALPGEEEPAPTFVVIPVKGKWEQFTKPLLKELIEQGGYTKVFVLDNASGTPDAVPEDAHQPGAICIEVIPAAGKSIHQMWNMGIRQSLAESARCNIAILNNDLEIGPEFLERLAQGLRAHPSIAAVSPNYDGRDFPEKVQAVKGIAAGREDGTGGLAGFAFMVRGEVFTAGCPLFDERFHLWYGDNDFTDNLDAAGATYGIVKDATCVHIGGGSNTSGGNGKRLNDEWKELVEEDRKLYEQKRRERAGMAA